MWSRWPAQNGKSCADTVCEYLKTYHTSGTSDDESNTTRRNLRSTMEKNRKRAISALEKQAKRMKKASDAKFKVLERGTTVTIPVPEVDRSKCNLRNIIGKATSHYSTKKLSQ